MEKKPNITPTPWVVNDEIKKNNNGAKYMSIDQPEDCATDCIDVYGDISGNEDNLRANAQAIVTAVNCTYGANINPEKIVSFIRDVETCLKSIQGKITANSSPEQILKEALNNIKYKD